MGAQPILSLDQALVRGESPRICDYAVIGDCRSAALVSKYGSIDWLCWPRFDSPSIFAALLDRERGGRWSISPVAECSIARRYLPDTNILQTEFTTDSGTAVLTDLMPVRENSSLVPDHEIIRQVECTSGEVEIDVLLAPRARYGETTPKLEQRGKLGLRFCHGRGVYWLRGSESLSSKDDFASLRHRLRSGEALLFSLSYTENAPAILPDMNQIRHRMSLCADWWRQWVATMRYEGEFREEVTRSALTLKLLIYVLSGAVVAAPTTSLPERIGGSLNWDYRYCWLRDASLTIRAMLELGYLDEAAQFLDWMLHATRLTQPQLRILYTVFGNPAPKEWESKTLRGYQNSAPVRIGNAARDQLQLDVYGEVIDAASQYTFHGGRLDHEMQKVLVGFGNYVLKHWDEPDEGIWEPRNGRQNHTHSRLMCWTALDRLVSLAEQGKLKGAKVDEYKRNRDAIQRQISTRAWNERLKSYVSVLDGEDLDASLLLLSWYGFEKADSPRMQATHDAILKGLGTRDGLLYRYRANPPEGTFAICSFWEAEYLALGGGKSSECRELMKSLFKYHNDIGLYGEEIDAETGEALGNFPQAFTHIGLIGAALSLDQRVKGEQQLGHRRESAQGQSQQPKAA
ncbi:MAG TPA: glycoside hydrolase family 15 protein [Terriglobales bacterium]|nr:glycoside hydrolase family 15 protein [Terriglobales bacterium]